jgi:ketosteroid isomerase-like protein
MKSTLPTLIALLVFVSTIICQQRNPSPALDSLVAAERAFARTSVEKGVRESFLEFFADDGINFQPHPTKTREALLKRPAPAERPPVVLNWEPIFADVSRAGDLGYTTGPYTFTDRSPEKRPTRYGFYFSIWKKQPDDNWKVVVDAGIETPDHSREHFTFTPAQSQSSATKPRNLEDARAELLKMDEALLQAVKKRGASSGFLRYLGSESRMDRDGMLPLVGPDAIKSYLDRSQMVLTWSPLKSDVSASSDLGYTYGSYEMKTDHSQTSEKGYYVRVWKRALNGDWKLVFDTHSPIPPDDKQ